MPPSQTTGTLYFHQYTFWLSSFYFLSYPGKWKKLFLLLSPFTIRIPIAAGNSIVATETFHSPAFSHITFAITKLNVNDGTYNYYLINGIGTAQVPAGTNIVGGDPAVRALEITLTAKGNKPPGPCPIVVRCCYLVWWS